MTLAASLQSVRDEGFDNLYPVYGGLVDIVTITEGQSELLLQGTEIVVYKELKTLIFDLTTDEITTYGIGVGVESKKFVIKSETGLVIKTEYLVKYESELYEVIKKTKRNLFNEWRVIGSKIQNV